jgi:hypothetical protein
MLIGLGRALAAPYGTNNRGMQHTPNQLNQFFGDVMAGRFENLPDPQPQIAVSEDHQHFVKVGRAEGGFNVYRRRTGDTWEEATLADFEKTVRKAK